MEILRRWARYILRDDLLAKRLRIMGLIESCVSLEEALKQEQRKCVKLQGSLRLLENEIQNKDPLALALDTTRNRASRITIDELRAKIRREEIKSQWYRNIAKTLFTKLRRKTSFDLYIQKRYGSWRDAL